jgi:hypothetical protein
MVERTSEPALAGVGRAAKGRTPGPRLSLTFAQLLVFAAIALPAVVALRASMPTIDLAYQIRAGQIMLDTGHVLKTDVFTFTELGRPWLNQQWGSEILLALLYRAGGWEIVSLARAAIAAASFWLLYNACRARGAAVRSAAWLSLGGLLVAIYGFVPRPQMFAFLLFAVTLAIVANRARHPRLLWLLPIVTLVWANLHGSFVLPPIVLILAWFEDRRAPRKPSSHRPILVAGACVVAATVNPYGLRVWRYVVDLSTNPEVRRTIEEWQPPRLATFTGFVFFASVVGVGAIALRHRQELGWPRLLGLALFFVMGVTAVRGIIWWALAAPVLVADLFPGRAGRRDDPRVVNAAIAILLVIVGVIYLPWFRPTFASSANSGTTIDGLLAYAPERYTLRVAELDQPGARIFTAEIWAAWVEFAVPMDRVMVDPRIELFPSSVWHDDDVVSNAGEGWQRILDRWEVDVLALSEDQQSDLIVAIEGDPNWQRLYSDDDGVLLVRRT